MNQKPKLLFVITQLFKGGAEVALLNLLNALSPDDYTVDLLIFDQVELQTAVSLIPQIPKWVNVCNAAENESYLAYAKKIFFKIYRKITKKQLYRASAYRFVKNKEYDFAFSYGEWMSPEFIATKVNAAHKSVWIHTDIDKALYVDEKVLFGWDKCYQTYIFVSERSRKGAESKYTFIKGRSHVIHNMCDDAEIINKSKAVLREATQWKRPILLTVANIRAEKNHMRQIEAMNLLQNQGVQFTWLNIGCAADPFLKHRVDDLIQKYGLQSKFLFLGSNHNPYQYMMNADAVCVLSDYESWSMVITEAKLLGIPVIATKTSGALEQIIDGATGILCDFTAEDIAAKILNFFNDVTLQKSIRFNLAGFSTQSRSLSEFEKLLTIQ